MKILVIKFIFYLLLLNINLFANNINVESIIENEIIKNLNEEILKNLKKIDIKLENTLNNISNIKAVEILDVKLKNKIKVKIVFLDKLNKENEEIVNVTIKIYCPVVIASKNIFYGEKLNENNLEIKEKDISSLSDMPFFSIEQLKNKKAKKIIAKDKIVTNDYIEDYLINIGDMVYILYENENIRLIDRGRAEESGKLNEIIKVRNIKSKKLITGKVISKDYIKVGENL